MNVYTNPEKFGLEIFGSAGEVDSGYYHDLFVVWRSGVCLYYASHSGCSCIPEFENYGIPDLTSAASIQQIHDALTAWSDQPGKQASAAELHLKLAGIERNRP